MTPRDIAKHYLKFWSGRGVLSDNAPDELRTWVIAVAPRLDRTTVHDAMSSLAGHTSQGVSPTPSDLARWYADRPKFLGDIDAILASKKPPKTYGELLERAYSTTQSTINGIVRDFLKQAVS